MAAFAARALPTLDASRSVCSSARTFGKLFSITFGDMRDMGVRGLLIYCQEGYGCA
ncbi:hypothetical protein [Bradyrhizobium sp.]|uniref:hypothetical protein n=1 Tax=Bradyrhizobium sp. TaxID=376 RepID=UPI003BB1BE60